MKQSNVFQQTLLQSPGLFSGQLSKFEKLFRSRTDPWRLNTSPLEKKRYAALLKFVKKIKPTTILELGCAEGAFTKLLYPICKSITAVDVSATAIKRAKKIVPEVEFICQDFTKMSFDKKFSLIIAAEVLYYQKKKVLWTFLKQYKGEFLLTSDFLPLTKEINTIIASYGYKKIGEKHLFRIEDNFVKAPVVCLWQMKK